MLFELITIEQSTGRNLEYLFYFRIKNHASARLTVQEEVAGAVVQVGDDGLDVIKGHGLQLVVPEVQEVHARRTGQKVWLQVDKLVLAEPKLPQVPHAVQRLLRDVPDLVLVELQLPERRHLDERLVPDHGDQVIAEVQPDQVPQAVETVAGDHLDLIIEHLKLLQGCQVLERLVVQGADVVTVQQQDLHRWQVDESVPVNRIQAN